MSILIQSIHIVTYYVCIVTVTFLSQGGYFSITGSCCYMQGSNLALVHLSWQVKNALGQVKNDSNCPLDKQQCF